ncbi:insulinase family protein [Candidatus Similichlamydia laticola]|uniref:Peptidase M16 C-terminal domain-containing protein n=1 Tax=Candidatus Similichlamydia laticola TaxID=2170265 RepID=A0A369K9M5_9BACT|nr:insulinase family protein [Candidatus Similichlamydia laticola]RDB31291.1 hypothetical protein HAT2_00608 [Candidatus Similichlamydia laticola]
MMFGLLTCLFLWPCSFFCKEVPVPIHHFVSDTSPYKGHKNCHWEKWKLSNGLSLLLIHDIRLGASECYFGLSVPAGAVDDPSYAPGTAHLLAHLIGDTFGPELDFEIGLHSTLFKLRSEWEPFSSDLSRFLSLIHHDSFCPFDPTGKMPALHEIEAERHFSSQQDAFHLWSTLLNQLQITQDRNSYGFENVVADNLQRASQLRQWFDCYYTAEESSCIVSTPKPLSEVRNVILEILSGMRQKTMRRPKREIWKCNKSAFLFLEMQKGTRSLSCIWPFLEKEFSEKQHPLYLLTTVMEGLTLQLRDLKWATSCQAHLEPLGYQLPTLFCIRIDLTEKGVQRWEGILSLIDQFLSQAAQLKNEEIEALFSELKKEESEQILTDFPWSIEKMLKAFAKEPLQTFPLFAVSPLQLDSHRYRASIQQLLDGHRIVLLGTNLSEWQTIQKLSCLQAPKKDKGNPHNRFFFPNKPTISHLSRQPLEYSTCPRKDQK